MSEAGWNNAKRVEAIEKWRAQSTALGAHATQAIIDLAAVKAGERVLDLASGSGEPAISLAKQLAGSGHVTGSDISPRPLEVARARAVEAGLDNIDFVEADVHKLPFADASFDCVTSRLGVMFFRNLPLALEEIHRVLAPGGRAAFLCWGSYEKQGYFTAITKPLLKLLEREEIPPVAEQMFKFGDMGKLTTPMLDANFANITAMAVATPYLWPGEPEELWEYFQKFAIPWQPLIAEALALDAEAANKAVLASLEQYRTPQGLDLGAEIILVSADK